MPKLLIIIISFVFSSTMFAQDMDISSALNIAGNQGMLSQRIMKDYLLIGAFIKKENAQIEMDESVAIFEESFLELQDFAPTQDIQDKLTNVEDLWMKFRMAVVSIPTKDNAAELLDQSTDLLKACHDVVQELEKFANVKSAKYINISSQQRMLAQRIGLFYTAYYWEVPNKRVIKEFEKSKELFESNLNTLIASELNTPEIMAGLNKVAAQWNFSKKGFDFGSSRLMPRIVYVTTNSIEKKMNLIVDMYETVQRNLEKTTVNKK